MIYGLYLSAAGLQANSLQMDILANNLANADTPGFKHEIAVFSERRVEAEEDGPMSARHRLLDNLSGGTFVPMTYTMFEQGSLETTNRPLDVAIRGEGFLQVRDGERDLFTRDGRLVINVSGQLVTLTGKPLMSDEGKAIFTNPSSSEPVSIGANGEVRQGDTEVGRLALVEFADNQALIKVGGGLYDPNGQVPTAASGQLDSGVIERSTMDALKGLAQMVLVGRAYQINANLISLQDEMLGRAVNDLGRVG